RSRPAPGLDSRPAGATVTGLAPANGGRLPAPTLGRRVMCHPVRVGAHVDHPGAPMFPPRRREPNTATTARQVSNLIGLSLPFLGFVLAVVLCWDRFVEPVDLVLLAVGYTLTCLGITVGFHRLLTHRSFKTSPTVRYGLAVLGTLAVEGSVIKWVTDHRKHHDFADEEGDPHSPHEAGLGALKGLWHAHMGWLFTTVGQADRSRYGADLLKDPGIRAIDAAEKPLIAG